MPQNAMKLTPASSKAWEGGGGDDKNAQYTPLQWRQQQKNILIHKKTHKNKAFPSTVKSYCSQEL